MAGICSFPDWRTVYSNSSAVMPQRQWTKWQQHKPDLKKTGTACREETERGVAALPEGNELRCKQGVTPWQ